MLERTAGCLESGSLRCLLPTSRKSLKSRRTLHSGFWNHAAGDLELSSPLWAALVRSADSVAQEAETAEQKILTGNGGMFLDFLYPVGTMNLFKHYSGWGVDRQDSRWASNGLAKLGQRLYTSSATDPPLPDHGAYSTGQEGETSENSETDILRGKMGLTRATDYEEAWRQYLLLGEADRIRVRKQLIQYYSTSDRVLDAERTIDLFEGMGAEERDAPTYQKTIRSYLRLRNLHDATLMYRTSLEILKVPAGADELLAHLFNLSSWSEACDIWSDVQQPSQEQPQFNYDIYTLVEKLPNFRELLIPRKGGRKSGMRPLFDFAQTMIRMALFREESFKSTEFSELLDHLISLRCMTSDDFQRIYKMLISLDERKLLIQCYEKVRRETRIEFRHYALNGILKIFCRSHNIQGMNWVLDDFVRCHGRPSEMTYRICLTEFAAQGDATTVHTLFDQYMAYYVSKAHPLLDSDRLSPILQVHAKRGEIDKVIKAFNEISDTYGLKPTILSWNILISAHCKVQNIDEAFTCLQLILESPDIDPDDYTIGTLMGICVNRGDLESAVELYRYAEDLQIKKSAAMVDCLVLAHVQDDRFQEAEEICVEAAGMDLEGSRTRMWNYLIVGCALNRDLPNGNRILQRMSSFGIEPDEFTYTALMQALCMVRQPNQCLRILREVLPAAGYKVNAFHFAVIMGGYVATKQYWKVFELNKELREHNIRQSASTNAVMLRAQVSSDAVVFKRGTEFQQYQSAVAMFLDYVGSMDPRDISDPARKLMKGSPLDIAYPTSMYSYIMYVLAQSNDTESAKELFESYKAALPENRRKTPPISILSALLLVKWRERDMNGVEESWNLVLAAAKEQGSPLRPPGPFWKHNDPTNDVSTTRPKILYAHEIELAQCLSWYLESLAYQGLADKMIITVHDFIRDGFVLDMRNWNTYIQLLAREGRPKLAFEVCEKYLMPNWTGWSRIRRYLPVPDRLPKEIRAKRKNPRHIRPITTTLLILARSYMDIVAAAAESKAYRWQLDDLERLYPKTVDAIKTMQRSYSEQEEQILKRF
ncbi:Pentatricopeptide repeat-containing-like protein [Lachnellula hyalina]|uniref:Pentatricopeptide repeat-containing-like protein n=1 Tax=Lachnellula hyalina TaxID=1316788 RepID=A0A8H8R6U6_9HELO|nr:Pentatricopeptide repeat-containing-like protein [Lachnellula hyalina]TVY29539.1 Pentatricopeptide repeat-containing-like protein [Lachnellula hyalina]